MDHSRYCKDGVWKESSTRQGLTSALPDKTNFKSIPNNLNVYTFNEYIVDAPKNQNSKSPQEPVDLHWKRPKSIHTFRLKEITVDDVMKYFSRLPYKLGALCLVWQETLEGCSAIYLWIFMSCCQYVFSLGVLSWWLEICKGDTLYKQAGDVNTPGNYRPISMIGHIAKKIDSLIGCKWLITWKNIILLAGINSPTITTLYKYQFT